MRLTPDSMHGTLSWVIDSASSSEWIVADLIARDIEPRCGGAIDLVTSGHATLELLHRAKGAFKAMRLEGETDEDRRIGSQLYAATIAAAIVGFDERISRQRDVSLQRALERIADDLAMPAPLRDLAQRALVRLTAPS